MKRRSFLIICLVLLCVFLLGGQKRRVRVIFPASGSAPIVVGLLSRDLTQAKVLYTDVQPMSCLGIEPILLPQLYWKYKGTDEWFGPTNHSSPEYCFWPWHGPYQIGEGRYTEEDCR